MSKDQVLCTACNQAFHGLTPCCINKATNPLDGRPDIRTEPAETNALARDLGQLARRHKLRGCVLISFTDDRVGVNSSGEPDRFGRQMELLGDRLLAAIDDGKFEPVEEKE